MQWQGDLGLPNKDKLVMFQFLMGLTRLFQKCWLSGIMFITLKKSDVELNPFQGKVFVEGLECSDNKCLLKTTDGKNQQCGEFQR